MKIRQKGEKDRKSNPYKLEGRNPHTKLCLVEEQKLLGGSKRHRFFLFLPLCVTATEHRGRGEERERYLRTNRERRSSDPSLFFILHVLFFWFLFFSVPMIRCWQFHHTPCFPANIISHVCNWHTWKG